jgi:Zn-dependent protease
MNFVIIFFGWIFSLCLHEFGHAIIAYRGGDYTVKDKGYLTFNPLRYTDPLTSLIIPLIILMMGGIGLPGGAVYIETWRLRSRYWISGVALAGPTANLIVAIVLAIALKILPESTSYIWPGLSFLLVLQVWAIFFNLIPIPPLDGYNIIAPFLNPVIREQMERIRPFAIWILILALWYIPVVGRFFSLIIHLVAYFIFRVDLSLSDQGYFYISNFFKILR